MISIKEGQTVWVKDPKGLIETQVTKVGRKYFEVQSHRGKFYLDTMKHYFNASVKVYISKESHENQQEFAKLNTLLRQYFVGSGNYKHSLEDARNIAKILKIEFPK